MSLVRITKTKDKKNPDDPKGIVEIEVDGETIALPPMGQSKIVSIETKVARTRIELPRESQDT